jgi:polysaccharide pyruvyl transferase WcaK-like protein
MRAALLDPAMESKNIGDMVINDAVRSSLKGTLKIETTLPTQRAMTHAELTMARDSDIAIVGGTNLLSSNMPWYRQWKIGPRSVPALKNKVVLMGVGWWQYQDAPNRYTSWLLGQVLSREAVHSVRDEYTRQKIAKLGFDVLNTACPTMWNHPFLPGATTRPSRCVLTLTDYNRDPVEDQWLLDEVRKRYTRVSIWPQSVRDARYATQLQGDFSVLKPTLNSYNEYLDGQETDYIGTRLHGGIRAMQRGHWGLIVAVDNRAIEIGRDTGLPVLKRGDRRSILQAIDNRVAAKVDVPLANAASWKAQFSSGS